MSRASILPWASTAALLALAPGCGLVLDFDPEPARHLECFATVRNAEGLEVEVSSLDHPDFVQPTFTFSGGGGVGGGGSGGTEPIRPYYASTTGSTSGCHFASPADAESDWRQWLGQRIGEVAAESDSESLFAMHAGPWCVVPGSLRCEERERVDRDPACGDPLTAAPLADCSATPPPGDRCLEVSCGGAAPCTSIDFDAVPTVAPGGPPAATELITLCNCGEPGDQPVRVRVDPAVTPITAFADYSLVRNECAPRDPEEERFGRVLGLPDVDPAEACCELEVGFGPLRAGRHEGRIAFSSDVDPSHEVALFGGAEGGALRMLPEGGLCLDMPAADDCSLEERFVMINDGPGVVIVRDFTISLGAGNFRVVRPPPPPLPIVLAPGESADVVVQWCLGDPAEEDGELTVVSNADPPPPPIPLRFERAGCP